MRCTPDTPTTQQIWKPIDNANQIHFVLGRANRGTISPHVGFFATKKGLFGVAGVLLDVTEGRKVKRRPPDCAKPRKVPPSRVPKGTPKTSKSGQCNYAQTTCKSSPNASTASGSKIYRYRFFGHLGRVKCSQRKANTMFCVHTAFGASG